MLECKGGVEANKGEVICFSVQLPDHGAILAGQVEHGGKVAARNDVIAVLVDLNRIDMADIFLLAICGRKIEHNGPHK